ncbi:MAG: 4Fe-4S dicluster domain-containing protein [Desulfonatronovibrio sp. MSAO_Bac4]|nr:MAG: 4Fe-4S dicluster domain-containing protein [Desulfonatronovibrio sp. MSAO_Bac4]
MAKKKGESSVKVYSDWCKGCGICVAFCPAKVLKLSKQGKAEVINEYECINCGFCEVHCPDFAILVHPKNGTSKGNGKVEEKTVVEKDIAPPAKKNTTVTETSQQKAS